MPEWFTTGRTVLIPKDRSKSVLAADNARPINCLPGLYKLLTKLVERELAKDLDKILTDEQKGCRTGVYGAQHQLLIDRVVTEAAQKEGKDLFQVWLDMRKAFDSLDHKWILCVLRSYGIDPPVVSLIERLMSTWRSVLTVNGRMISDPIPIKSGIFQGDSLSPLLFITAINPISWFVGRKGPGITLTTNRRINHLLYVDDWKLFANTEAEANELAATVQELSLKAGLRLNQQKCAVAVLRKGKHSVRATHQTPETELLSQFPVLRNSLELTKYLGVLQNGTHNDLANQVKIKSLMMDRVRQVTKLKGKANQLISAINGWALGAFKYIQ